MARRGGRAVRLKQSRRRMNNNVSNRQTIGRWFMPPANPPIVLETKWRYARLKIGIAAAGDSGAITQFTGTSIFAALKTQQGIDVTAALSTCRVLSVRSYALQGVADSGGQTYPSTKIRAYAPMEDSAQGVLLEQREDAGTLSSVARIGYHYPKHLRERVIQGTATNYFCETENYHCARGIVYIDIMWATQPN